MLIFVERSSRKLPSIDFLQNHQNILESQLRSEMRCVNSELRKQDTRCRPGGPIRVIKKLPGRRVVDDPVLCILRYGSYDERIRVQCAGRTQDRLEDRLRELDRVAVGN